MNLFYKISKVLYWPICRAYARSIGDKPADNIYGLLCGLPFWQAHHYWPDFTHPKSLNEKIWHRMLYDRSPRFSLVSDKWLVRDYISKLSSAKFLIPLIWHGNNPEEIPFSKLPHKFVIKANHGCGYNIIVHDKHQLDIGQTIKQLKKWIRKNFCNNYYFGASWAYKNIQPYILVEQFIGKDNQPPRDYKFFCYSGRAEYVQVSVDRYGSPSEQILDRDFNQIKVWNGVRIYPGIIERPSNYEDMINLADSLSKDFEFIRVDLYSVEGTIYFGEMTLYHAGGLARFIPKEYDYIFGSKWQLTI